MIDIDELKHINDRHGHAAGSRLIQVVSNSLKNCVRSSDVLARFGGDEFVVMLNHAGNGSARLTAERIRAAIADTSFDVNGQQVSTTASIGIASFPDDVSDAGSVLDKADIALYKSKKTGRNKVTFYDCSLDPVTAFA
jgi:diguanylate cyclase (GGDEF)-like protein